MFKDSVVLITGAASGIGFAAAKQFTEQGATVIGADFNESYLKEATEALGDNFIGKQCDVTSEKQIMELKDFAETSFGKLDSLINNAGRVKLVPIEEMVEEDFYYHFDVLVKAPMLFVKHFASLLRKSDNPSVVNVSSINARNEFLNNHLYSTAKAAMEKLTRHIVRDLTGIRANTLLPGVIDTRILMENYTEEDKKGMYDAIKPSIPMGRVGVPDDVANCILFLCSKKATYISGAAILIDGGYLCNPNWGI